MSPEVANFLQSGYISPVGGAKKSGWRNSPNLKKVAKKLKKLWIFPLFLTSESASFRASFSPCFACSQLRNSVFCCCLLCFAKKLVKITSQVGTWQISHLCSTSIKNVQTEEETQVQKWFLGPMKPFRNSTRRRILRICSVFEDFFLQFRSTRSFRIAMLFVPYEIFAWNTKLRKHKKTHEAWPVCKMLSKHIRKVQNLWIFRE